MSIAYKNLSRLLSSNNYRIYNVDLARKLESVSSAIVLGELLGREEYHEKENQLIDIDGVSGWFYETAEKMEERTALKRKAQDNAIDILVKHGLITKTLKDSPPKRFFHINHEAVVNFSTNKIESTNLSQKDKSISPENPNEGGKSNCPKGANRIVPKEQIEVPTPYNVYMNPNDDPKSVAANSPAAVFLDSDNSAVQIESPLPGRSDQPIPDDCRRSLSGLGVSDADIPFFWSESGYDVDVVRRAVAVTETNMPSKPAAYLRAAIRGKYQLPPSDEQTAAENKVWLLGKSPDIDGKRLGKIRCTLTTSGVEFCADGGVAQPKVFEWSMPAFKEHIVEYIETIRKASLCSSN